MQLVIPRIVAVAAFACVAAANLSCGPSYREELPPGSPFLHTANEPASLFPQGVAIGDVTSTSAIVWLRTARPAPVLVEYRPKERPLGAEEWAQSKVWRSLEGDTEPGRDLTLKLELSGLEPATSYLVRLSRKQLGPADPSMGSSLTAEFKTLPSSTSRVPVVFGWSGDLGGQTKCRTGSESYPIFSLVQRRSPDFFLFLGDTIYADEVCGPPNFPGSEFKANTLQQYRAKHRYQRGSMPLQRFLAAVPVYVTWDDHDVRNNFAGPFDPQMPDGRQALLDYWPIREPSDDPHRLYRRVRVGADLELFVLDTRQYRHRNAEPDGPAKTMLGIVQRDWLLEGLRTSDATWKVIASSVPLSNPKPGTASEPGQDGWAGGADGTGFETELGVIARTIADRSIRNVVWLTGDVHFVQGLAYDVDGDGLIDFHEFTAGPLSAATGRLLPTRSPFATRSFISEAGFQNFGLVKVDGGSFAVTVIDEEGKVRYSQRLDAR
ncbi:MAG TPA: alkaline phosphatase D family protein [Nitrospiraceae bacterium]|nr:alkaline phosphatase D family protein [Nitrospiraceae bacterium]